MHQEGIDASGTRGIGQLHRDGSMWAGADTTDADYFLLRIDGVGDGDRPAVVSLGEDAVGVSLPGDGMTLSSPHTPVTLTVGPTSDLVFANGQRVPMLPVCRWLLAHPGQSYTVEP